MKAFLFPIFLPLIAWGWLLAIVDIAFGISPESNDTGPTSGAWATVGYFVLVVMVAFFLQAGPGLCSHWILQRSRRLSFHLAVGVVVALGISLGAAAILRAPQLGETIQKLLPLFLFYCGPPMVAGYALQFRFIHHASVCPPR